MVDIYCDFIFIDRRTQEEIQSAVAQIYNTVARACRADGEVCSTPDQVGIFCPLQDPKLSAAIK